MMCVLFKIRPLIEQKVCTINHGGNGKDIVGYDYRHVLFIGRNLVGEGGKKRYVWIYFWNEFGDDEILLVDYFGNISMIRLNFSRWDVHSDDEDSEEWERKEEEYINKAKEITEEVLTKITGVSGWTKW